MGAAERRLGVRHGNGHGSQLRQGTGLQALQGIALSCIGLHGRTQLQTRFMPSNAPALIVSTRPLRILCWLTLSIR